MRLSALGLAAALPFAGFGQSLPALLERARAGDAAAQYAAGKIYRDGQGVAENFTEALRWFRKAADAGNADAEDALGFLYDSGQGVPENHVEAVRWYRKAAAQGNPDAEFNLASLYDTGQGVPQDHAGAVHWYRRAASHGDADAQFNLGVICDEAHNYTEAARWYREAAIHGMPVAETALAKLYEDGRGVPRDYVAAYLWMNLAVATSHGQAQETYSAGRDALAGKMTAAQLAQAQKKAMPLPASTSAAKSTRETPAEKRTAGVSTQR